MNAPFRSRLRAERALAGMLLLAAAIVSTCVSAVTLTSGRFHSFIVRDDGTVAAWGYNAFGQIGDGSYIDRSFPVTVSALNGVTFAIGGANHSLALKSDGTVWAWGSNSSGQLGDGTTVKRALPVKVNGLAGVKSIAAGYFHSLALKTDGTVWTWGDNSSGELGDGTTTGRLLPVRVAGLTNIVAIAGGAVFIDELGGYISHSVALRSDGTVWAWGDNTVGQLGDGTTTARLTPVQVKSLAGIVAISANGAHTLALAQDNSVSGWGFNYFGELGNGTDQNFYVLANRIPGLAATQIAAGNGASYARRTDGTVAAWGDNYYGQLGDGTTIERKTPVSVPNSQGVDQLAAGAAHFLYRRTDGAIFAAGQNVVGQVGDGNLVQIPAPSISGPATGLARLAPGYRHSLVIKTDGTVAGVGDNSYGQLGDNTFVSRGSLTTAVGLTSVVSVASGPYHSVALKADGTVWTWGFNSHGQLGNAALTYSPQPAQVPGLTGVVAIASGFYHVLALKSDGSLWAWGFNRNGQIGDGTITSRSAPTRVLGGCVGCPIAAGGYHNLVLRPDGTMFAWGGNSSGELGDGTTTDRTTPVTVSNLNGIAAISAGAWHSLALKTDGSVVAWGWNGTGQLGTNSYASASTATPVQGASGVTSISAGGLHSMALKSDGTVLAWGLGGSVGDGTDRDSIVPTQLMFIGPVEKIAAGLDQTLAITRSGSIAAWGSNYSQKLGIPFAVQANALTKVRDPLAKVAGADLVVEFFNPIITNGASTPGIGHYFITANALEAISIDNGISGAGWQRTGRVFRAWRPNFDGSRPASAPASAVPVYRFYAHVPNSHFYTASEAEKSALVALNPTADPALGWALESVEFYTVLPQGRTCPAGYQPIYRAYNNRFSPNPALNDGNHRLTPSAIDFVRATVLLGYTDEGVAFCSPTTTDALADLQAWYYTPGAEVQSGSAIAALFVFANNGPGAGDNGKIYITVPDNVTNWTVCIDAGDINCVGQPVDPQVLRAGFTIDSWPAGLFRSFLVKGTAPQVPAGGNATLTFGALATNANGAPDGYRSNNAPGYARTLVKSAQVCSYAINPATLSFGPGSNSGAQVTVPTSPGCNWSVANGLPWVNATPSGGTGSGALTLTPAANPTSSVRSGTITIAGQTLTVSQAGIACTFAANPSSLTLGGAAQNVNIAFTTVAGCGWTARSSAPWFVVAPGAGTGNATLTLSLAANASAASRTGSVTIGGLSIPIVQSGTVEQAVPPAPPPNPCASLRLQRDGDQMPPNGLSGESSVGLFADPVCAWNSQSSDSWLTITGGGGGMGNGTLKYAVQPNPAAQLRIGKIQVGGLSFTVTQQGRDVATDVGDSGGDNSGGGGGGDGGGGDGGGSSGGSSG